MKVSHSSRRHRWKRCNRLDVESGEVRLINLGTPPLHVDEHGAVEGLVSFDAAEVDQRHIVVKVRFLKHALLSEVPGTVGDGI